jgi:hypothetical protein
VQQSQEVPQEHEAPVMGLLARHVPISLLVDLATRGGPDSRELLEHEGCPEQPWWEGPA